MLVPIDLTLIRTRNYDESMKEKLNAENALRKRTASLKRFIVFGFVHAPVVVDPQDLAGTE